ncbi:MAG: hypothetical protein ACYC6S_01925 [Desulfobulbia bacterium]
MVDDNCHFFKKLSFFGACLGARQIIKEVCPVRSLKLQIAITFLLLLFVGMQLWRRDAMRADTGGMLLMDPSQSLLGNRSGWTP